jgi:hypothetical protein
MKKTVLLVVAGALIGVIPASALVINDPWTPPDVEINLYEIYDALYGIDYGSSANLVAAALVADPDQIWSTPAGMYYNIYAEARYAGAWETFGYYQPTGGGGPIAYTSLFTVGDDPGEYGLLGGAPSAWISPTGDFGFFDRQTFPAGSNLWHSEDALNSDGMDHLLVFSTPTPNVYLLAWEDKPDGKWDQDYQDLVVEVQLSIIPEPATLILMGVGIAGVVIRRFRRVI